MAFTRSFVHDEGLAGAPLGVQADHKLRPSALSCLRVSRRGVEAWPIKSLPVLSSFLIPEEDAPANAASRTILSRHSISSLRPPQKTYFSTVFPGICSHHRRTRKWLKDRQSTSSAWHNEAVRILRMRYSPPMLLAEYLKAPNLFFDDFKAADNMLIYNIFYILIII